MGAYARSLGRLVAVVIALMGVFAGVAQASAVTNVTAANNQVSQAVGARTVYNIGFRATTAIPGSGTLFTYRNEYARDRSAQAAANPESRAIAWS